MAESELRNMVMNFRVSDLQVLLGFAGKNKTGKKQELQSRALDLVKHNYPHVITKIEELHNRRYHNQLLARPTNYEIPDRPLTDRPISSYESAMNNNYGVRCNPNPRPLPMNHGPPPTYSGKPYLPPIPPQSHFSSYADVKFRELPFYDTLHILLRPFNMIPDPVDRNQESTYTFSLSPQEAHDIAVSKDATGNYECQILLRFCLLEAGTEQDDNFPPNLSVKVNGKQVPLPTPIPTNRPCVEPKRPSKPINITPFTKLSPTVSNVISVSWNSSYGRTYAAVLYVARLISSFILLQRLKNRGLRSADLTKSMIIEKLQQGLDSDIATTSLQASLICPLGKLKMGLPCRAVTCTHIACFDALLYIQLNEKKAKWRCPVCDKPALFKNLMIDGLFMDIVSKVPAECTDVQLHDDGSWTPILPIKEPKEVKKMEEESPKKNSKEVEIVDISSDSDTDDVWKSSKSSLPPCDAESPPLMFISPDDGYLVSQRSTPPVTSYAPPVSSVVTDYTSNNQTAEPVPVCLTSVHPEMVTSDLNILPDIPHSESALSSTCNSAINSTAYPNYQSSDTSSFNTNTTNTFHEQTLPENSQNSSEPYIDFFSLLSLPESEQLKYESMTKELNEKESNSVPDVISLD